MSKCANDTWDKVFPLSEKVNHKKVSFQTQYGFTLVGDLYTPKANVKSQIHQEEMKSIDTTNMCSHLQRKLFAPDGEYRAIREQIESDPTLTAVVRSRQLHIYRNGKKVLVLAGKSAPKIIREDKLTELF